MTDLNGGLVALLGIIVGLITSALAIYKTINAAVEGVRRESRQATESVRKELDLKVEKVEEVSSKARHAHANGIQVTFAKFDGEIDRLKRDYVRREEMAAFEARVTANLGKLEGKLDQLGERLQLLPVLEANSKANGDRLEKLIAGQDGKWSGRNA